MRQVRASKKDRPSSSAQRVRSSSSLYGEPGDLILEKWWRMRSALERNGLPPATAAEAAEALWPEWADELELRGVPSSCLL